MNDPVIQTENLSVFYGIHRGIVDVDLAVQQGEVFGFLGPNGAGKTTTQRVLLDVIRPTTGSASIFGLNCQTDGVAIRERIGYVPGELALPGNMLGRSWLNMLDGVRPKRSDPDYRRQLCARLDLDISRRINQYSKGNKQKLGLVAAFMHKPDLLILDEPTSGLDPLVQQTVLELVREAKEDGRTVFFSSHILPEVQAVCDRVGIIREGKLVAVQNVRELLISQFKRIRLQFAEPVPPVVFEMDGIRLMDGSPSNEPRTRYTFEVREGLDRFLQTAVQFTVTDIETLDLSLEEVFLSFYGRTNGLNGVNNSEQITTDSE